ncbi:amidophosphoribosyltransferase [Trichonephila clavata]|uniref:Amidophosphoribosyltransferase n=1 Tax=Trichonephila clavata TaxID=2740835 RepID=A0A8X6ILN3_TRICU|nr:amidophosphoribosyltransferase [Trichonephila clavata]
MAAGCISYKFDTTKIENLSGTQEINALYSTCVHSTQFSINRCALTNGFAIIKRSHSVICGTLGILAVPAIWPFLRPYHKQRICRFWDSSVDPLGIGYNAQQSQIAIGSGGLLVFMLDEMREECGVFGISCNQSAAFNSILALHALQHRGQESFGVVTSNNDKLHSYHFQGQSDIDTEVVVHLTASGEKDSFLESFIYALKQIQGAYSFVAINQEVVIGVRDSSGIRPLVLGKLNGSYVLASETCALDIINAEFVREIEPGELVTISSDSKPSLNVSFPTAKIKFFGIFEYVYFSRPDSIMENRSIYDIRKEIGRILAEESPPKNNLDMVVPIPDSGIPAAIGYAKHSGLPMELGIIRNHYIGRTFIQPTAEVRKVRIKLKFNANKHTLKDTPECKDLIAANKSVEEIKEVIGVDSLAFLSIDGLYQAVKGEVRNNATPQYCDACFTGDYPIGQIVYARSEV